MTDRSIANSELRYTSTYLLLSPLHFGNLGELSRSNISENSVKMTNILADRDVIVGVAAVGLSFCLLSKAAG